MRRFAGFILIVSAVLVVVAVSMSLEDTRSSGEITGRVVTQSGKPVIKAEACAMPIGLAMLGTVPCKLTQQDGSFTITRLPWAKFRVYARKQDEGYPDKSGDFFGDDGTTVVTLSPAAARANAELTLGPRAGVLTGAVTNARTGDKAYEFRLKLSWVTDSRRWISIGTSPEFRQLVPANVDLTLQCEAPGYQIWDYKDIYGSHLRLNPGQVLNLSIKLKNEQPTGRTDTTRQH